jgi:hypothetical protein
LNHGRALYEHPHFQTFLRLVTVDCFFLPLADFAQAVQLKLVVLHLEAVLPCYIFLQRLDALVLELDDGAAMSADEVIVVRVGARVFVPGEPVLEPPFLGKPRLGQELERPVHRGKADAGVQLLDAGIQLLGAQVPAGLDKDVEDLVPLAGRLEPPIDEVFTQMFCRLFLHNMILKTIFNM